MSKITKFIILIAVIVVAGFIVRYTPLSEYFTKEHALTFFGSIRAEWWGPVAFILIYGIGCVIALPGSILTLAGGAVFGVAWGTFYNVLASNLGASLAFLTARYLGRDFIRGLFSATNRWTNPSSGGKGGKLAEFDKNVARSGFKTMFRLRLIPIVPFNGLNFGAGLSSVKYRDYLWGSFLGMLPATFIYTYFADALLKGVQGTDQKALWNLLAASALLILISFLPAIYKRIKGASHGPV